MWQEATSVLQEVTNTYDNTMGYAQMHVPVKKEYAISEETQNNYSDDELDPNVKVFNPNEWSLDKFEIGRYLGNGRFGHVYLARERKTKFVLAIKVISKRQLQVCDLMGSLDREVEILTHLKHPNIIDFYGFFQNEKRVYLMLEWAPKGDLFGLMRDQPYKRFTEQKASIIIKQIASALGYMHQMKVIHRDLKPENILCFENDVFKISDFGWSVHTPSNRRKTLCGTLDYLCPEMLNSKPHDNRVDIWTLGVLAYELVVGRPPFEAIDETETKKKIQSLRFLIPNFLSKTFVDFVVGILQHDCNQRPTIQEILQHPWLN